MNRLSQSVVPGGIFVFIQGLITLHMRSMRNQHPAKNVDFIYSYNNGPSGYDVYYI